MWREILHPISIFSAKRVEDERRGSSSRPFDGKPNSSTTAVAKKQRIESR